MGIPSIVLMACLTGRPGGQPRRSSGAVISMARDAGMMPKFLLPSTIATLPSPIGSRAGPRARRIGAASTATRLARAMPPLQERAMQQARRMEPITTGLRSLTLNTSHTKRPQAQGEMSLAALRCAIVFGAPKGASIAAAITQQSGSGSVDLHLLDRFLHGQQSNTMIE